MIAAAHANHPRERTAMSEILVLRLSWSFQMSGIGIVANRTSVTILNANES
jgi:hypothetical protein